MTLATQSCLSGQSVAAMQLASAGGLTYRRAITVRRQSMQGRIIEMYIARRTDAAVEAVQRAHLLPGQGIEGDRYFRARQESLFAGEARSHSQGDSLSQGASHSLRKEDLTLISADELDEWNEACGLQIPFGEFRRNVITRGIDLNALVGRRFRIGSVECVGIELCEPCSKLARLISRQVLPNLVHRAGLRAAILSEGMVVPGDTLQTMD
jgi:MOSC domain-containing protein YiiM